MKRVFSSLIPPPRPISLTIVTQQSRFHSGENEIEIFSFSSKTFQIEKMQVFLSLILGKRRKTLTARNILTNRKKNIPTWLKFHPIFLSIFRPERKTREKLSYDSIFELLYSTYNTRLMNNLHACELFMGRKLTINQGLIVYPIRKRTRFAPLSWRGRVCTPRQK